MYLKTVVGIGMLACSMAFAGGGGSKFSPEQCKSDAVVLRRIGREGLRILKDNIHQPKELRRRWNAFAKDVITRESDVLGRYNLEMVHLSGTSLGPMLPSPGLPFGSPNLGLFAVKSCTDSVAKINRESKNDCAINFKGDKEMIRECIRSADSMAEKALISCSVEKFIGGGGGAEGRSTCAGAGGGGGGCGCGCGPGCCK